MSHPHWCASVPPHPPPKANVPPTKGKRIWFSGDSKRPVQTGSVEILVQWFSGDSLLALPQTAPQLAVPFQEGGEWEPTNLKSGPRPNEAAETVVGTLTRRLQEPTAALLGFIPKLPEDILGSRASIAPEAVRNSLEPAINIQANTGLTWYLCIPLMTVRIIITRL